MNRLIARVLGEAVGTGVSTRSDQLPPRPEPEIPPRPETPDDDTVDSLADQQYREGEAELAKESEFDKVLDMWKSGSKYDACEYMLFSNFLYTDFIRLIRRLPEEEGLEMGNILDEIAPDYTEREQAPSDTVSAVAGAGGMEMP